MLGMISLSRKRVQPFTDRQIELVRTFADQAVIAMENARLLGELQARTRELEELLEYQTATATCSTSSAARPPMCNRCWTPWPKRPPGFAALMSQRSRYARARSTALCRPLQLDPEHWAALRQRTIVPGRDSIAGRVALEGRVVHVEGAVRITSALTRTSRCPKLWRPGIVPALGCRCCARGPCLARLLSDGNRVSRTPSGRSNWCAPLPTKRSSRSRMRGCSVNCRRARATSKNRSNTRPRPATCSRSSAARPPMCSRCWTQWSKRPPGFAAPMPERS